VTLSVLHVAKDLV